MNIYDIASKAGVSISTVSRVLNNPDKVKASTRKKVEDVFAKHHYLPNAMARGLVHNSMKTIGILSIDYRHLQSSVTACITESLFFNWGYSSILCNTGNEMEKKIKYIRTLAEKKLDGLVLISSFFNYPEIGEVICQYMPNTPVVMANATLPIKQAHSVLIDIIYGLELAVSHLADKGHKDILFVLSNPVTHNVLKKADGFRQAMKEKGLYIDSDSLFEGDSTLQGGIDVVDLILESKRKFTAIIFADELTAIGAVKRLKQKGFRIPEDVAIVGYNNSTYSQCSDPELTTIDTRNETYSNIVANTLHDLLQGREVGSSIIVRPELVIREST